MAYLSAVPAIPDPEPKNLSLADEAQPPEAVVENFTAPVKATAVSLAEEVLDARGEYDDLPERLDSLVPADQAAAISDVTIDGSGDGTFMMDVGAAQPVQFTVTSWAVGSGGSGETAPTQVTGLTAVPGSADGEVDLDWDAPSSPGSGTITTYSVQYRLTTVGGSWSTFSHSASTATSITVTGLTGGQGYDFRVAAVSDVPLTGTYSDIDTATPDGSGGTGEINETYDGATVGEIWTQANGNTITLNGSGEAVNSSAGDAGLLAEMPGDGEISVEVGYLVADDTSGIATNASLYIAAGSGTNNVLFWNAVSQLGDIQLYVNGVNTQIAASGYGVTLLSGDILRAQISDDGMTVQLLHNVTPVGAPIDLSAIPAAAAVVGSWTRRGWFTQVGHAVRGVTWIPA